MVSFRFDQLSLNDIKLIQTGVGVLPTDTVYGLVAPAVNPDLVQRLYDLKSRERKPGTIIASNTQQLIDLGVDPRYIKKVERYWPNPVSIVIPVDESLTYLHQGVGSLAFRVVSNPEVSNLLNLTGPLLTSSANQPGDPVASTVAEARKYFGDQVDFYIDGGDLSERLASTIIKIDENGIVVLRQGSIEIKT